MENIIQRFLKYTSFDTQSQVDSDTFPSTPKQKIFAHYLAEELKSIGLSDVNIDQYSYVTASLPATSEDCPAIGFIAHIDTSPDCSGANINPQIIKNYNGKDIILNKQKNIILSPKSSPELLNYIGQDLITTDGTTLLGADDKAGIAEIVTAMEYLIAHPNIQHGKIRICFTPDEEVGNGAEHFDTQSFNADYAYTVDGGEIGEIEYENFNAAHAVITINGINVHTGYAYHKMINSMLIATEFINLIPSSETPENTKDLDGFYHLNSISGDVEKTVLHYFIRDFDKANFEHRKNFLTSAVNKINQKFGENIAQIYLHGQYYNMRQVIENQLLIVDIARQAMIDCGIQPKTTPVRGGTDGARLSFMGLPTPNLFAGGLNFHSRFEFLPIPSLIKASEVIVRIAELTYTTHFVNK